MPTYYCPYCNTDNIIEYITYFKCKQCKSTFDKQNFETFRDKSNLLSLEELNAIAAVLKKHSHN